MLNDNNAPHLSEDISPRKITKISDRGSSACRRAIGEGYYDQTQDKTFVAWNEKGMDIYMANFDHKTNQWSAPELVYACDLFGRWEYHDYVTMIQGLDGNPLFLYHIHSKCAYIISKNQQGEWERSLINEDANDYPAPIFYQHILYYFYSQNREIEYPYRPLRFCKSFDNGKTWTIPRDIVDTGKKTPDKFDEVYQTSVILIPELGEKPAHFLITYTMWGGTAHANRGKGSFCIAFSPQDDLCYDLDGNSLGETVDYDTMLRLCCAHEGYLSASEEYRFVSYGSLPSYDQCGNAIVVYGLRCEEETGVFLATRIAGSWERICLTTEMWNVKDVEKQGEALEIVVCHGDQIVIFRRDSDEEPFHISSKTQIPHNNGSDCIQYANLIEGSGGKILVGLIERENHEAYCDGVWPVLLLEED
ncbi:MAG: hypothetical protein R3Y63_07240 [Eubacteriales bacterium]